MNKVLALFLFASWFIVSVAWAGVCCGSDHEYNFSEEAQIASGNRTVPGPSLSECGDLYGAAKDVLKYLDAPSDRVPNSTVTLSVLRPIPTELENAEQAVTDLKEKNVKILRFRKAVQDCENALRRSVDVGGR